MMLTGSMCSMNVRDFGVTKTWLQREIKIATELMSGYYGILKTFVISNLGLNCVQFYPVDGRVTFFHKL